MRAFRAAAGLAVAGAAYAVAEPYRFRLAHQRLAVGAGTPALKILHLSDAHALARSSVLFTFLRSLPEEVGTPDLVVATGDMIEDDSGIAPVVEALSGFEATLGRFYVLGSHDYYQARFQSITKYFRPGSGTVRAARADVERLEGGLRSTGWVAVTNTSVTVESSWGPIRIGGVDDPYLRRHHTGHIRREPEDASAIGLVHAPNVVSEWLLNGYDVVCAGHTHGGQVRLPFTGAVVTNCDLPTALAMGPHRIGAGWLHVSPGLGTSKFSPIRFLCRPEATVLELVPVPPSPAG